MKYFAAHLIMYFEREEAAANTADYENEAQEYFVLENILLFREESVLDVYRKAMAYGKDEALASNGEHLTWEGQRVKMFFGGVRKVVECTFSNKEGTLSDGDEITYQEMIIIGKHRLDRLINDDEVEAFLLDGNRGKGE